MLTFLYLTGPCRRITLIMSTDIEFYTRKAGEMLHKGQDEDAVKNFYKALKHARKSTDTEAICKCTLNLGAALVALGRTSEGLKVLESAVPQEHDHLLSGDLSYNLCLAHENLDDTAEAIKCIQKAIKCYSECSDANAIVLKAGSACMLAFLHAELQELEEAAEAYADAASSYSMANDVPQQAVCLFEKARMLGRCNKRVDAIAVADMCAKLCTEQPDAGVGKYKTDRTNSVVQ